MTWDKVCNYSDVEAAFDTLTNEITDSIQRTIPEKTLIHSTTHNPSLSKGILKSITHKNKLYIRYIENPNTTQKNEYTNYKNKLTHIRKSKSNHYTELIKASQGDAKKSWKVLNKVLNRGQKTTVFPDKDNTKHQRCRQIQ